MLDSHPAGFFKIARAGGLSFFRFIESVLSQSCDNPLMTRPITTRGLGASSRYFRSARPTYVSALAAKNAGAG
jgi:hypothetical protein